MRCVVGTAGHIDHGKSALVRALTGIETDRLPEEQRRGISIELGFAWLELPDGERAAIVDVPGHERFVRHMLAGAHGFDLVLVVVAADDGVMPQTEEHFEIVHLLGARAAMFVITKADLVDAERIEDVREEIEILASGTALEGAPTFVISSRTGEGIEALRDALFTALAEAERDADEGPLRLPVDRAFHVRGHGLVVTGTASAGCVRVGQEVVVLPRGDRARVREVQSHGDAVELAGRGQRVALNLSGVDASLVARGMTIAGPGAATTANVLDVAVEIRPLAGRRVRSHSRVRLHLHTQETGCRLVWMDGLTDRGPRETGWAQLVAGEPLVAARGDRFVLRDETGAVTLGGGVVALADVPRRRGAATRVGAQLEALADSDDDPRLEALFALRGQAVLDAEVIERDLAAPGLCEAAARAGRLATFAGEGGRTVALLRGALNGLQEEVVAALRRYHAAHPERGGMELEPLRRVLSVEIEPRLFRMIVDGLDDASHLCREANLVRLPEHRPHLNAEDEQLADKVAAALSAGGAMPPTASEMTGLLGTDAASLERVLGLLASRGLVVRVSTELYFDAAVLRGVEDDLRGYLAVHGEISAGGFRDLISASRKYCIPLLDHLDRSGLTIRVGDVRKLRG